MIELEEQLNDKATQVIAIVSRMHGQGPVPIRNALEANAEVTKLLKDVYRWGVMDATLPGWGDNLDVQVRSTETKVSRVTETGENQSVDVSGMGVTNEG